MGYGLLCVLYPEDAFDLAGRIDGALTAYACGDALGLPWENVPATNTASAGQIEQLPAREGMATRRDLRRHGSDSPGRPSPGRPGRRR
jgi:hypothetical protein